MPPAVSLVKHTTDQLAAVSLSRAELTGQEFAWSAASPYSSGFGNLAAFATKLLVEWQPTLWICSSLLSLAQRNSKEWLCGRSVTQEKQQLASQDWLQQPKRLVCLLGKLQVTACVSTTAYYWNRCWEMQCYQGEQWQSLWSALLRSAVMFLGKVRLGYSGTVTVGYGFKTEA